MKQGMTHRALIPVKSLNAAKSRLAAHLTLHQRADLVLDMLHHVIQTLCESNLLEQISVVSPDHRVLAQAKAWGAQTFIEELPGHNAALHMAALKHQQEGTTALLTIAADLPLLHPNDIRSMIEKSLQHQVVLAPSRDGTGTNAILVHPPLALPYLFGTNSFQRYQQAARQHHLSYTTHHSLGLALDIDTIDDLDDLYELQALTGKHIHTKLAVCNYSL